ncbi:hypothetical protein RI578_08015 [Streptomyces sp. BB1-1-1]|uniref:hypothetical protein n=1 Tax=Streptomyces sp. BB1-1-1 TaxID=3074430 RepID=UPI0028772AD8|nr:hypothetical protein [Streptomyces sp. BB1-1-1]WND34236.1 hypothetical protein RI578_08015 [Streptomyces sp. BB1-1-1]
MSNEYPAAPGSDGRPTADGQPTGHQGGPYGPPPGATPPGAHPAPPVPGTQGGFGAPGGYAAPAGHGGQAGYAAPAGYGAPGSYGAPGGYGAPGAYGGAPGGYPGAPYPYAPVPPPTMPGSVRAAQILIWVMAGLVMLVVVIWGAGVGAEDAGRLFATNLMGWVLFVLAFRYGTGGNGVRVASIVLASVQIVMSLGGIAQGNGGGGLPLFGAIAIVVLLNQSAAAQWFKRPRAGGLPYGQ